MTAMAAEGDRRSSIDKPPIDPPADDAPPLSAFERLPDEIIEQILHAADPNGFASLVLLNTKWRAVSQQAHLYAHHLSACPSYAASHKGGVAVAPDDDDALPRLRRLFAREVKRNLFDAYLRPRRTVVKVISNSISSSSCPGGEGIRFSASPRGHHVLAYNSSRIYVLDVRGPDPDRVRVPRELKILRRPVATCVNDEGSTLVVLLTEMELDIYDLRRSPPKRTRSLILDHSPRAVALSPCSSVLAVAYDGGIEVSSIVDDPAAAAVAADRRAVKCDAVDALAFSFDGTQILGTTVHAAAQPTTVVLTAPYYDPASHHHVADNDDNNNNISTLWTTSILFPNTSHDCSHAVLLQNGRHEEAVWTFTYDRSFETFRAVRIDDLRNGTTYFTGPVPSGTFSSSSQPRLLPCTLPAASYRGDLVSAGFQGKDVWLYGIPEDLEAVPDGSGDGASSTHGGDVHRRDSGGRSSSGRAPSRQAQEASPRTTTVAAAVDAARVPQWQILCDKFRNTFVAGRKIAELDGVHMVKWVAGFGDSPLRERLVIAARGVLPPKPVTEEDGIDFVDGGRVTLLDFDYGVRDGETVEITIEVGTREPEALEEERRDIDTEVAIVRRRTVAQQKKRGGPRAAAAGALPRTARLAAAARAASSSPPPPPLPSVSSSVRRTNTDTAAADDNDDDDPLVPRRVGVLAPRRTAEQQQQTAVAAAAAADDDADTESMIEEQEALDAPYSHASPRSGPTLRRAATAAAANRRLHPAAAAAAGRVEYRRADGRAEHPHESDADQWVPPPPPYQKEDPGDLPAFLRHAVPAVIVPPAPPVPPLPQGLHGPLPLLPAPPPVPQIPQQPQLPMLSRSHTVAPAVVAFPPPAPPSQPAAFSPPRHQRFASDVSFPQTPPSVIERVRTVSGGHASLADANIYDVSPPGSPEATASRRHARAVSHSSVVSGGSPASSSSPAQTRRVQQPPRIRTSDAALPSLDLQIPSPSLHHVVGSPMPRPLSNSQTWPAEPGSSSAATAAAVAAVAAGYPHSAPPADVRGELMMAQALRSGGARQSSLGDPTRMYGDGRAERLDQPLLPAPLAQQDRPAGPQQLPPLSSPSESPTLVHPQPRRGAAPPQPTAVEDTPLIISTPRGVVGGYDPPGRHPSGRSTETPLLAPVPRHARPAVLRPTVEGLETTIYGGVAPAPSPRRKPSRASRSVRRRGGLLARRGGPRQQSVRKGGKKKAKGGGLWKAVTGGDDGASSAAWTDVTGTSAAEGGGGQLAKDKKCVVM